MRQDINLYYSLTESPYGLSIITKISDLEWPWTTQLHITSHKTTNQRPWVILNGPITYYFTQDDRFQSQLHPIQPAHCQCPATLVMDNICFVTHNACYVGDSLDSSIWWTKSRNITLLCARHIGSCAGSIEFNVHWQKNQSGHLTWDCRYRNTRQFHLVLWQQPRPFYMHSVTIVTISAQQTQRHEWNKLCTCIIHNV